MILDLPIKVAFKAINVLVVVSRGSRGLIDKVINVFLVFFVSAYKEISN